MKKGSKICIVFFSILKAELYMTMQSHPGVMASLDPMPPVSGLADVSCAWWTGELTIQIGWC